MRTLRLFIGAALIALAAPAALAKTAPKPHRAFMTPPQMFQALYNKMDSAERAYNLDGFFSLYSPQYTSSGLGLPAENFAGARRDEAKFLHLERFVNSTTTVMSVTPIGDGTYFVVARTRTTMVEPLGQGRTENRVTEETDQDYWDKEAGHWKIREENALAFHIWINGAQTM